MQVISLVPPKMGKVNMMCDQIIDEKLTKYPAVESAFSRCNFTILAGTMGQGKTTLAINLMRGPLKKCYNNIYTIIPEISLHSISPKDNIFMNNMEEENVYNEYNADVLQEIYEKLEGHANENEFSLLVIDDMGAVFKRDKQALVILNRIITKIRHLKTTVILLAQNIYQLPKQMREIATNLITYNLGKSQMFKLFKEFFDYNEDQYNQIMKLYKNPHDWLLLNLKQRRLFFKFEKEIVFSEEPLEIKESKD